MVMIIFFPKSMLNSMKYVFFRILYGDSGPFFALVGVSLASGTGILTKEEELEGVCWEIREAISKLKWNHADAEIDETQFENVPVSLADLSFGKPIAKGANAVVYAAKFKEKLDDSEISVIEAEEPEVPVVQKVVTADTDDINEFPLALKMMFNYDIQSNAMAILNAMYRETVPARVYYSNIGVTDWEIELSRRHRHLPQHPNIVAIFSVFTDYIPELEDCRCLYPAALPKRLHPEGEGRNMSLFLLMKRYDTSLQDFLSSVHPSTRTSILLFTQLLEGIAHLTSHGIAHRDLKSDNLLLDMAESEAPVLVISDFGCCLSDKNNGLMLPYTSYEIDKGGNAALMAPEIVNQQPGTFSVLNYSKSDLWAAGAIAYEIFGSPNPFYAKEGRQMLKNTDYKESDLPELPEDVPFVIRKLVEACLRRRPNKRIDPEIAANVCQLFLWAPSSWLKPGLVKLPSSTEILQWLLSLTTKVLCQGKLTRSSGGAFKSERDSFKYGRRTYPEYLLISCFLYRAKLANVRAALSWIHAVNLDLEAD
ncbi:unnamed protein product [Acanthoscelides obtectus]|uniref:non-specific serine/threonine protein kinase n=1 Tax=Acanthoscelides obtectus TaxID=200917 RepID=A0A9P0JGY2_ACAOB|nr:unnamed protein product [Acanthoscelides obtectus]CAK1639756.1 Serine/threonine-protein kinase PINK1, mitochondrial [Acanthoscelides obtectus]